MPNAGGLNKSKEARLKGENLSPEIFEIHSDSPEVKKTSSEESLEKKQESPEQITSIGPEDIQEKESINRVVDTRSGSSETVPIKDTRDKLTQLGDEEESNFIKGVAAAHDGSDES